ncbi:hypothetical protein L208DRAFT_1334395, partial [Tricholoma matsutake]
VVSIVAIHGLDGHPMKSWTAANDVLWLRDLLPEKIPHAHILTYGCDAYICWPTWLLTGMVVMSVIKSTFDIHIDLSLSQTQQRPIIFVVHSLGGIVLKNVCQIDTFLGDLL